MVGITFYAAAAWNARFADHMTWWFHYYYCRVKGRRLKRECLSRGDVTLHMRLQDIVAG